VSGSDRSHARIGAALPADSSHAHCRQPVRRDRSTLPDPSHIACMMATSCQPTDERGTFGGRGDGIAGACGGKYEVDSSLSHHCGTTPTLSSSQSGWYRGPLPKLSNPVFAPGRAVSKLPDHRMSECGFSSAPRPFVAPLDVVNPEPTLQRALSPAIPDSRHPNIVLAPRRRNSVNSCRNSMSGYSESERGRPSPFLRLVVNPRALWRPIRITRPQFTGISTHQTHFRLRSLSKPTRGSAYSKGLINWMAAGGRFRNGRGAASATPAVVPGAL
jgi:hypothetical protein